MKNARDEELAKKKKIETFLSGITDEKMRSLPDADPTLYELYGCRINGDYQSILPWQIVIDKDLRTRAAAGDLCSRLMVEPTDSNDRFGVLNWLYYNSDVPWAHRILKEAVIQNHSDKAAWVFPDVRSLARLVSKIGDASHIEMLREMQQNYSVGMEELILKKRLGMETTFESSTETMSTGEKPRSVQDGDSAGSQISHDPTATNGSWKNWLDWRAWLSGVLVAGGLLYWRMATGKTRGQ